MASSLPLGMTSVEYEHGQSTSLQTRQSNIKILITGDSITQGAEGDFTWRYRLYNWLRSTSGTTATFVGPYHGTQEPTAAQDPQPPAFYGVTTPPDPPRDKGGYATPVPSSFSTQGHFALWGRQAAQVAPVIQDVVHESLPDYLLVALGFNDMGWLVSDWSGTLTSIERIVNNSRIAKPDVKIVLATVPMRTFIRQDLVDNTTRYNQEIRGLVKRLSLPGQEIRLAEFAKEYACTPRDGCAAAYDGLHPNALGEWQIAKAFSDALVGFGVRQKGITVPAVTGEYTVGVPNVVAAGAPWGVKVTWDKVYGSRGYDTRQRVKGSDTWSEGRTDANRMDVTFTAAAVDWEFQVRAGRGSDPALQSAWSDIKTATSRKDGAPGPKNIQVTPRNAGVGLTWSPPDGTWAIDRYQVTILDKDIPGAYIQSWSFGTNGAAFIDGLVNGHTYDVWVSTWAKIDGVLVGGNLAQAQSFVPTLIW
ncbi:Hypothetical protein D9617_31g063740 [Elsinoe fawcettii]|nr:Hypothetical protein D9617_31g063740 [Elsinoe fawcettii]